MKEELQKRAKALGFSTCRIADPKARPDLREKLETWLGEGHHGSMNWMEARKDQRADPLTLWNETRSIIMLAMNYAPNDNPLTLLKQKDKGIISAYARGRDYHDVIKGKLKELAGFLHRKGGGAVKVFVDTAPVMEKPLAQQAGLGWQGKHTVLLSRDYGNWLFLGAIFTSLELPFDEPETDHCGTCRKCLDICPTNAFPQPYVLDARRCIAYLTIEHKGPIPEELREALGNRIFGCDDCLAICPWNKFAKTASEMKLANRPDIAAMPLRDLAHLDEPAFRTLFAGTPIKRTGWESFMRNVLIAIGNSGEVSLAQEAQRHLQAGSLVVKEAAIWAVRKLAERS